MDYIQCRLTKGNRVRVSFLPKDVSKEGNLVALKDDENDCWEDGWLITNAYKTITVDGENLDNIRSARLNRKSTIKN